MNGGYNEGCRWHPRKELGLFGDVRCVLAFSAMDPDNFNHFTSIASTLDTSTLSYGTKDKYIDISCCI
jgi:hypothetical protein